jgi:hypothetical protein
MLGRFFAAAWCKGVRWCSLRIMRALRTDGSRVVRAIERDGGPEIEARAAGEEIIRHVLPHAPEARRPAEHADLVVIARPDHVGAGLDQHLDHLKIRRVGGEVKRVGVVTVVADVDVGAALEQQPDAGRAVSPGRHVQRRPPPEVSATGVDQIGMRVEKPAEVVSAAVLGGIKDQIDRPLHRCRTVPALLEFAGEQLDLRVLLRFANLVERAAVVIGHTRIEALFQHAANGVDVARPGSSEHPLANGHVHMGLELAPTCETVVTRHRQLGVGQPGLRVMRAQRLAALLGFVFEMFEIRQRRQLTRANGRGRMGMAHE